MTSEVQEAWEVISLSQNYEENCSILSLIHI